LRCAAWQGEWSMGRATPSNAWYGGAEQRTSPRLKRDTRSPSTSQTC
jgi:hypothetical protein